MVFSLEMGFFHPYPSEVVFGGESISQLMDGKNDVMMMAGCVVGGDLGAVKGCVMSSELRVGWGGWGECLPLQQ